MSMRDDPDFLSLATNQGNQGNQKVRHITDITSDGDPAAEMQGPQDPGALSEHPGDAGSDAGFDAGAEAGSNAGGHTNAGSDARTDAGSNAHTDAGFDTSTNAANNARANAGARANTRTNAGSDAHTNASSDAHTNAGSDTSSDAANNAGANAGAHTNTRADARVNARADAGSNARANTGSDADSDAVNNAVADANTRTNAGSDTSTNAANNARANASARRDVTTGRTYADSRSDTANEAGIPDGGVMRISTDMATLETVTFESLVNGLTDARVVSLLHVIGWPNTFGCFAIAGVAKTEIGTEGTATTIRRKVRDLGGEHCIVGRSANDLTVALVATQGAATPEVTCTAVMPAFDDKQPVCLGPLRRNASGAASTIAATLSSFRALPAMHTLTRPMRAEDLLPERALIGDTDANDELYHSVYQSLGDNSDATLETVETFLKCGGSLDLAGRVLNVHPNTVRYRIKRAAEASGWDATDPRDAYVLRTAIILGRIRDAERAGSETTENGRLQR